MTDRYELECMGETVTMIVDEDGRVTLDGYDPEAEEAALALGFERSTCGLIAEVLSAADAAESFEEYIDIISEYLVDAAQQGLLGLVSALIAMGADYSDERAFMTAVRAGNCDVVQLFLDLGLDAGSGAVDLLMPSGFGSRPNLECLGMLLNAMGAAKDDDE